MEWDKSNFNKLVELFGLDKEKLMPVGKRHRIVMSVHMKKMIMEYKDNKGNGKFTNNFFNDFRNHCEENHLIYSDAEVSSVFEGKIKNPYSDIDGSIKLIDSFIRTKTIGKSKGKEPHKPFSITWSQFYDYQMSSKNLINMYEAEFRSSYNMNKEQAEIAAEILFKKCFYLAMKKGSDISSGDMDDKGSGQFQPQGINILAAKHDRSDYAQGEKYAFAQIMKAFCLMPNSFLVNVSDIKNFLANDLNGVYPNIPKSLAKSFNIEDGISLEKSFSKICNTKELELAKEMLGLSNGDVSTGITMDESSGIYSKDSFSMYPHGYACKVSTTIDSSTIKGCLDSYYEDEMVKEIKNESEGQIGAWAITVEDLTSEVLIRRFPLEKTPKYSNPELFVEVKNYLEKNIPNGYNIKVEDEESFVVQTTN